MCVYGGGAVPRGGGGGSLGNRPPGGGGGPSSLGWGTTKGGTKVAHWATPPPPRDLRASIATPPPLHMVVWRQQDRQVLGHHAMLVDTHAACKERLRVRPYVPEDIRPCRHSPELPVDCLQEGWSVREDLYRADEGNPQEMLCHKIATQFQTQSRDAHAPTPQHIVSSPLCYHAMQSVVVFCASCADWQAHCIIRLSLIYYPPYMSDLLPQSFVG